MDTYSWHSGHLTTTEVKSNFLALYFSKESTANPLNRSCPMAILR